MDTYMYIRIYACVLMSPLDFVYNYEFWDCINIVNRKYEETKPHEILDASN